MTKTKLACSLLWLTFSSSIFAEHVASSTQDIDINNQAGLSLNSHDFYFRINGRLMVDYAFWHDAAYAGVTNKNGSGSEIRRSRIYLKGKYHDWQYRFQTNFNQNGATNSNTYIKYAGFNAFDIYLGKHAEPFGLESSNSSKFNSAIERPVTGNSHFAGDRELGVSIAGHQKNYAYQLGVYDIASTPTDNNYAITGRVSYLPIQLNNQLLHLGLAASVRQLDEKTIFLAQDRASVHATSVKSITTGEFFAKSSRVYNIEASYQYRQLQLSGEYQLAKFTGVNNRNNHEFTSYYLQASYFLTPDYRPYDLASGTFLGITPNQLSGAWELFSRYESVDFLDNQYGSTARILTSGINYFATQYTRLSVNYTHAEIDYGRLTHNSDSIDGSALTFRVQFYW
ncbi:porin P [Thalassotalea insulae]|uniref:Porin P n=1 Tax=Thalassotalea insulae TaxID=2056778 RepID=A0ABQ6H0C8_9GAMM|nr:porin [Thalassotalea insulae]GLX80267.1 porin P [Thalassotalea insulae]